MPFTQEQKDNVKTLIDGIRAIPPEVFRYDVIADVTVSCGSHCCAYGRLPEIFPEHFELIPRVKGVDADSLHYLTRRTVYYSINVVGEEEGYVKRVNYDVVPEARLRKTALTRLRELTGMSIQGFEEVFFNFCTDFDDREALERVSPEGITPGMLADKLQYFYENNYNHE